MSSQHYSARAAQGPTHFSPTSPTATSVSAKIMRFIFVVLRYPVILQSRATIIQLRGLPTPPSDTTNHLRRRTLSGERSGITSNDNDIKLS